MKLFFTNASSFHNLAIFLTLTIFLHTKVLSQDSTKPVYIYFSYIKTLPGQGDAYRELIKTYGSKIFQSLLKDGSIQAWYLHQVLVPSGSSQDYNYVSVTVSADLRSLIDPAVMQKQLFKKILPALSDKKIDSVIARYGQVRHIVKREIYTAYTVAIPPSQTPSKYYWVGFHQPKPGKLSESLQWEKDNWTSIHKAAIASGDMLNWGVYSMGLPYHEENKYSYITVNFFDDLHQFENNFNYDAAIKKAWPNSDMNKIFALPGGEKTVHKMELYKLVDYVNTGNSK